MKRSYLLIFLLCCPVITQAAVGCMSKSTSLTESYDPKQLHYVQCNCPCGSTGRYEILRQRGLCRECGHYRELKRMQILTKAKAAIVAFLAKRPLSNNPFLRYFQERNSLLF